MIEHQIFIPKVSNNVEICRLIEWRKEEGDKIEAGDIILVYETQKASMSLEASVTGILKQILVPSGEWINISSAVGIITRQLML